MLNRNKYWKSTFGTHVEALIAKQVDYAGTGTSALTPTDTMADFVTSAVEGEFAFFNADTNVIITGATSGSPALVQPVSTSQYIYAAVKRDGYVEKSSKFRIQDVTKTRVVYAAGVAGVATATFQNVAATAGDYISVSVMDTTPGYQPFPRWEYGVTVKVGESLTIALARLTAIVNDATNIINKGTDFIVTATYANYVITFTAIAVGINFRLSFSTAAYEVYGAAAAVTAKAFYGNGTYDQVAELELQSDVYKGVTTQYPGTQGARPQDFGAPSTFATVGATYNIYIITGVNSEKSPTPLDQHIKSMNIILAIPSNGAANAETEVKGILGL